MFRPWSTNSGLAHSGVSTHPREHLLMSQKRPCYFHSAGLGDFDASCARACVCVCVCVCNAMGWNAMVHLTCKGPQPNNVSSTCYVQCLLETIDGTMLPSGSNAGGVLEQQLAAVASRSTDTAAADSARRHQQGGRQQMSKPRPRMTREELIAPFRKAFESTDPARGGCPEVPV